MNHARVALVLTMPIVTVVIAKEATVDSSAAPINVARQSRPHPKSHLQYECYWDVDRSALIDDDPH
jgi:hypothetical protein